MTEIKLPPLPEWSKMDDLNGLVPSEIRQSLTEYAVAAVEIALASPEIQSLRKDAERLDWLADPNNSIGNVQLPTECVTENLHSLRAAIDAARQGQGDAA